MLRKAMIGMAIVGLSAVDGFSVLQKRDGGGHGHDHGHEAPSSGYEEPASSYGAPSPSYGTPPATYGAPPPSSYGTPPATYGTPPSSYDEPEPSYGAAPTYCNNGLLARQDGSCPDEAGFPDLTPIIIACLALVGLSLLFPTVVNILASDRKKRAAEEANPMVDVVERVNEIYNSVIQSEKCMERIACELGGIAGDVGLKESPMAKMADLFVTAKYKPYYKQFKSGQNCEKIKCGSLPF
jgi:hypothetical protein